MRARETRLLKANPYHDEAGRFTTAGSAVSVSDMPSDVRRALDTGRFIVTAKPVGDSGDRRTLLVSPPIPEGWQPGRRSWFYDPAHAGVDEDGYVKPNAEIPRLSEVVGAVPKDRLFRGMSFEEYEAAKDRGYIQSAGTHNIGDDQKGLTYYTTDPDAAESYAAGFAPWQHKPIPGRPGVVVQVPDPGPQYHRDVAGVGEHERGVTTPIPFDRVEAVYFGDAIALHAGEHDQRQLYDGKTWVEGSSYSYGSVVLWRRGV